ncbi:MAG: enoyl-CoA hydratase/isomerase family protein [Phycisphaerales bacterium JB038]
MQDGKFDLIRDDDGFVTMRMEDPGAPALVLSGKLIDLLAATLDHLESMGNLKGLILASACTRVFVAGANLKEIDGLNDADLDVYLKRGSDTFARLARLPYPTVAAIDGAALGGGLEIAMHCDGLLGLRKEKPYPIGLPEAGLAICPGWGGTQLLPTRIDAASAIEQTAAGRPMKFDDAEAAGLFDKVVDDPEDLLPACKKWLAGAGAVAAISQRIEHKTPRCLSWYATEAIRGALGSVEAKVSETDSGAAVAKAIRVGLDRGFEPAIDSERASLIELRNKPAARERLEAFFNKGK